MEKQNKVLEDANQEFEEDDEYKYIFDDILGGISASQGFAERNILSPSESVFSKSAHKSMFSSGHRSRENWNQDVVIDAQDICAYADDYILANGDNIATIESGILNYLKTPGIGRTGMPSVPEKSELRRNAERPEPYPFCTVPIEEFERAMLLKALEEQFKTKEPDFEWNLFER